MKERFLTKWQPNYTIRRSLKNWSGEHPKVVEVEPGVFKWVQKTKELVDSVNAAISNLAEGGYYRSTLRQLYYQLVGKNQIPNKQAVYDTLGEIVTAAKYAGLISWRALEDRNRRIDYAYFEESVKSALEVAADGYNIDKQAGQPKQLLVVAEKDAVSNIVAPECARYSVRYSINKGYASSSLIYEMYGSVQKSVRDARQVQILYLGDHDPSGLNMVEDVHGRLCHMVCTGEEFDMEDYGRAVMKNGSLYQALRYKIFEVELEGLPAYCVDDFNEPVKGKREQRTVFFRSQVAALGAALIFHHIIKIEHVALTLEQVQRYNLPPNPAKTTDSRARKYIEEFGTESWELDAIPHAVLAELVREAIERHMDMEIYNEALEREKEEQEAIRHAIDNLK